VVVGSKKKILRTVIELLGERGKSTSIRGGITVPTPISGKRVSAIEKRMTNPKNIAKYGGLKFQGKSYPAERAGGGPKYTIEFSGGYRRYRRSIDIEDLRKFETQNPEGGVRRFTTGELRQLIDHIKLAIPGAKKIDPRLIHRPFRGQKREATSITGLDLGRSAIKRRRGQSRVLERSTKRKTDH
jgi:hypothetical protein